MHRALFGGLMATAVAGLMACSSTAGHATNVPTSVAGCITKVDNNYMLVPGSGGPVGTSGRPEKRYELVDDANVGVARWVDRQAHITGRAGETRADGTTVLHVSSLDGAGPCQ